MGRSRANGQPDRAEFDVVNFGFVDAAVFEWKLHTHNVVVGNLDLIRPHAPLEFLGLFARPLLFSLLLANALILYGTVLDVLHERGRCRLAMDLVPHIGTKCEIIGASISWLLHSRNRTLLVLIGSSGVGHRRTFTSVRPFMPGEALDAYGVL